MPMKRDGNRRGLGEASTPLSRRIQVKVVRGFAGFNRMLLDHCRGRANSPLQRRRRDNASKNCGRRRLNDDTQFLKKRPRRSGIAFCSCALVFPPEALRHLVAQVGAGQVMLGSDHPFVWEQHPVDHLFATPTLSEDEKAAILGGNAARLLGIKRELENSTARCVAVDVPLAG
jgi:hypothetical protein